MVVEKTALVTGDGCKWREIFKKCANRHTACGGGGEGIGSIREHQIYQTNKRA